jgi:transposase-like protein
VGGRAAALGGGHLAPADVEELVGEVARRLGIGRSTLYRKVRENGLGDLAGLTEA